MAFDKAEFPLQSKGKNVVVHSDVEGAKHLPNGTQAATGDVVTMGADRKSRWAPLSGVSVSSVFGRTGAVTAQPGDYTAAQVGALPASGGAAGFLPVWTSPTTQGLSQIYDDGILATMPGVFQSEAGLVVRRGGNDTRYLGGYIEMADDYSSPTIGSILQLNGSGGLSNWDLISSSWVLKRQFQPNGYNEIGPGSDTPLSGTNIRLTSNGTATPTDGWMLQPKADHSLGFWPRYAGAWHAPVMELNYGGVLTLPALAGGGPMEPLGVDSTGAIAKLGSAQSFGTASASFTYSTSTPKMVRTNGAITVTLPAASGFAGYETVFFQEQVAGGSVTFTGPFEGCQLGVWTHHAGSWGWSIGYPKLTLSCDGLVWYVVAA